jgi:hypothetical protein
MTIGDEDLIIAQWLTTTLEADNTLMSALGSQRVWDGPAPDGAMYPLLRVDALQNGNVVRGVGTIEMMLWSTWLIRAVDEGTTFSRLQVPAQRIQADLHGVTALTVPGGTIEACVRENAYRQQVIHGGREFRHLGAIFRIEVQGA